MVKGSVFDNFSLEERGQKTFVIVRSTSVTSLVLLYGCLPGILILFIYYLPLSFLPDSFFPWAPLFKLLVIIGLLSFAVYKFILQKLGRILLIIDKAHKTIKADGFWSNLDEIKEISVIEESSGAVSGMKYLLKFALKDGVKTSVFAFTSFDAAEALVKEIKSASEEK